jgi:hypothetical protein
MRKLIYRLLAALITFLIGLTVAVVLYQQNVPEVEPIAFAPTPAPPQPLNRAYVLSLCDLAASPSSYRGKEVIINATHIGFLSSEGFSVLSECAGGGAVSARINLAGRSELPEELLRQLVELMSAHGEWADKIAGQVTIKGRVEAEGDQVTSRDNFHIAAIDVWVQVNVPTSRC